MSVTPWIAVSKAFARSSAATGTRRGNNARMPAMVSGLVSENRPTSDSSSGALAQPRQSTAISATTHVALAYHIDGDRPDRTDAIDQCAGDGADRQSRCHCCERQPSCQHRRTGPRQCVEHDRQQEHASRQSHQQRGEEQRPHLRRGEELAVGEGAGCRHRAPRSVCRVQLCQRNSCALRCEPRLSLTLTSAGPRKFIASSSAPRRSFGSST